MTSNLLIANHSSISSLLVLTFSSYIGCLSFKYELKQKTLLDAYSWYLNLVHDCVEVKESDPRDLNLLLRQDTVVRSKLIDFLKESNSLKPNYYEISKDKEEKKGFFQQLIEEQVNVIEKNNFPDRFKRNYIIVLNQFKNTKKLGENEIECQEILGELLGIVEESTQENEDFLIGKLLKLQEDYIEYFGIPFEHLDPSLREYISLHFEENRSDFES